LAAELPRVRVHLPQATFLGWLDFSAYSPDDRTDKWLLRHTGIAGQDGENFGAQGADHVRFTFGVAPELLNQMIDQMVEGLSGI
jgi:cystathionine beta-lyase